MAEGTYTAANLPEYIEGMGTLTIVHPQYPFLWTPQDNKQWNVAANYTPAILPMEGDTVIVTTEIEAQTEDFPVIMYLDADNIRLRKTISRIKELYMAGGTSMSYASSGSNFEWDSPMHILGEASFELSGGGSVNTLVLHGSIDGNASLTVQNQSKTACEAYLVLKGDNSQYTGTFELTATPRTDGSKIGIQGDAAHSFGNATIHVGKNNCLVFNHAGAAGSNASIHVDDGGQIMMNTDGYINMLYINDEPQSGGEYNSGTHPEIFSGEGTLHVEGDPTKILSGKQEKTTKIHEFIINV